MVDRMSLEDALKSNASRAEELYNQIKEYNKTLTDKNLFNEQYVIDWQDRLNKVSITSDEDI